MKTGEVYFRDEEGVLWLCESFVDDGGAVTTKQTRVDDAVEPTTEPETL